MILFTTNPNLAKMKTSIFRIAYLAIVVVLFVRGIHHDQNVAQRIWVAFILAANIELFYQSIRSLVGAVSKKCRPFICVMMALVCYSAWIFYMIMSYDLSMKALRQFGLNPEQHYSFWRSNDDWWIAGCLACLIAISTTRICRFIVSKSSAT